MEPIKIGIFGGSGLYKLFKEKEDYGGSAYVGSQFGQTSGPMNVGSIANKKVAFMTRHGVNHKFPPHKVPYKANMHVFRKAGVERVIGPCASGSLQPEVKPGDFVICDQFVDLTQGRDDTYFHGPEVAHVSAADPYCPEMRKVAIEACEKLGIPHHPEGTVVVINGPRFSTRAESQWFSSMGWRVINMTQYPEAILARELEMCYLNISLITDYDVGLKGRDDIKPVSTGEVIKTFAQNNEKVKKLIFEIVKNLPENRGCSCGKGMEGARISGPESEG
jgi:5'-methylthioadenosine phosphorylase